MEEEKNILEQNNQSVPEKKSGRTSWALLFLAVILTSAAVGAVFGFMANQISQKLFPNISRLAKNFPESQSKDIIRQRVVEEDSAVIDVVENHSPAVVSIVISKDMPKVQDFFANPFNFPDFFGAPDEDGGQGRERQQIGGGSGFIISTDGMIVTNRHVVDDAAADYTVVTSDGKEYAAKVLAKDPINDFAVMKIEGNDFPTLSLGDSDSLKIGQTVIAIGNSLGEFSNTVSKGIISGLGRSVTASAGFGVSEQLKNIIQTDAAINPGNSGGPLLNIDGEVIGINVARAQGAENIGFAIPSNQIKKTIEQVKKTGKISVPYVGVRYILIDEAIQKENNLPFGYGALVLRGQKMTDFAVIPGSPADKAGILENDIILEVNGVKVNEKNGLTDILARYNIGELVTFKVWHKGSAKDVKITLEERK